MRKFLPSLALIATALVSTAASASEAQRRFTRDGETYVYTMSQQNNRIVLIGTNETTGAPFSLTVRGDKVSGNADGVPVSFRVQNAQAKLTGVETQVASR